MVVFPNCKINLGLRIIRKRNDGYHDLETVFYPIPLTDALEVIRVSGADTDIAFQSSGLPISGDSTNNLCVKAYQLLKKDFPQLGPVQMHLHKVIPMGAGLGGGSSDGAFALQLINDLFHLQLSKEQLIGYALQLGSDCPFFILNQPCFASGRGEKMEPVALDLSGYHFAIVNPGIHVNTGWAFSQLQLDKPKQLELPDLRTIIQQPVPGWKETLINDFEAPVCKAHPEIAAIKEQLYDAGAVYASMTGSGSTVFGLFTEKKELNFPEHYFWKLI